jgi:precorrin-2 methylase
MQPSFTLARQIENMLCATACVTAEGKPIDAYTFSFVMNHLEDDELELNLAMLPGICSVSNLSGKPLEVSFVWDALNAVNRCSQENSHTTKLSHSFIPF